MVTAAHINFWFFCENRLLILHLIIHRQTNTSAIAFSGAYDIHLQLLSLKAVPNLCICDKL